MSSLDKLLERMRRNPRDVRHEELAPALGAAGYVLVRTAGSHQVFRPANGEGQSLVVALPHGSRAVVSPAAVRDVLAAVDAKRARDKER